MYLHREARILQCGSCHRFDAVNGAYDFAVDEQIRRLDLVTVDAQIQVIIITAFVQSGDADFLRYRIPKNHEVL